MQRSGESWKRSVFHGFFQELPDVYRDAGENWARIRRVRTTASMRLLCLVFKRCLMRPLKLSDLVVGCYAEVRTRRVPPVGWQFVDGDPVCLMCPNGHRCDDVGNHVVCGVCGAVCDVLVETWSPMLRRFV